MKPIDLICQDEQQKIFLLSPGGAGKSTALYDIFLQLNEWAKGDAARRIIPVYVPLRELKAPAEGAFFHFVAIHYFGFDYIGAPDAEAVRGYFSGADLPLVVFLADGLNEINAAMRSYVIKDLRELSENPRISLVITSRYREEAFSDFRHFVLDELSEDYLMQKVERYGLLDDRLKHLLHTPFNLSLYLGLSEKSREKDFLNATELLEANFSETREKLADKYPEEEDDINFAFEYFLPVLSFRTCQKDAMEFSFEEACEAARFCAEMFVRGMKYQELADSILSIRGGQGYTAKIMGFFRDFGFLYQADTNAERFGFIHENYRNNFAARGWIKCAEAFCDYEKKYGGEIPFKTFDVPLSLRDDLRHLMTEKSGSLSAFFDDLFEHTTRDKVPDKAAARFNRTVIQLLTDFSDTVIKRPTQLLNSIQQNFSRLDLSQTNFGGTALISCDFSGALLARDAFWIPYPPDPDWIWNDGQRLLLFYRKGFIRCVSFLSGVVYEIETGRYNDYWIEDDTLYLMTNGSFPRSKDVRRCEEPVAAAEEKNSVMRAALQYTRHQQEEAALHREDKFGYDELTEIFSQEDDDREERLCSQVSEFLKNAGCIDREPEPDTPKEKKTEPSSRRAILLGRITAFRLSTGEQLSDNELCAPLGTKEEWKENFSYPDQDEDPDFELPFKRWMRRNQLPHVLHQTQFLLYDDHSAKDGRQMPYYFLQDFFIGEEGLLYINFGEGLLCFERTSTGYRFLCVYYYSFDLSCQCSLHSFVPCEKYLRRQRKTLEENSVVLYTDREEFFVLTIGYSEREAFRQYPLFQYLCREGERIRSVELKDGKVAVGFGDWETLRCQCYEKDGTEVITEDVRFDSALLLDIRKYEDDTGEKRELLLSRDLSLCSSIRIRTEPAWFSYGGNTLCGYDGQRIEIWRLSSSLSDGKVEPSEEIFLSCRGETYKPYLRSAYTEQFLMSKGQGKSLSELSVLDIGRGRDKDAFSLEGTQRYPFAKKYIHPDDYLEGRRRAVYLSDRSLDSLWAIEYLPLDNPHADRENPEATTVFRLRKRLAEAFHYSKGTIIKGMCLYHRFLAFLVSQKGADCAVLAILDLKDDSVTLTALTMLSPGMAASQVFLEWIDASLPFDGKAIRNLFLGIPISAQNLQSLCKLEIDLETAQCRTVYSTDLFFDVWMENCNFTGTDIAADLYEDAFPKDFTKGEILRTIEDNNIIGESGEAIL